MADMPILTLLKPQNSQTLIFGKGGLFRFGTLYHARFDLGPFFWILGFFNNNKCNSEAKLN